MRFRRAVQLSRFRSDDDAATDAKVASDLRRKQAGIVQSLVAHPKMVVAPQGVSDDLGKAVVVNGFHPPMFSRERMWYDAAGGRASDCWQCCLSSGVLSRSYGTADGRRELWYDDPLEVEADL